MNQVKIGKIYRHFKGNYYFIQDVALDSETKERIVVYRPIYDRNDSQIWVRRDSMFLEEIDGVGNVKVMISFESGEEYVYAQQEKSDNQTNTNADETKQSENRHNTVENEYIIIKNSGGETALIEKTLQPVIQGVAVVCEGADDIGVVAAVTNSISAVLNVPSHKVCVTKMR